LKRVPSLGGKRRIFVPSCTWNEKSTAALKKRVALGPIRMHVHLVDGANAPEEDDVGRTDKALAKPQASPAPLHPGATREHAAIVSCEGEGASSDTSSSSGAERGAADSGVIERSGEEARAKLRIARATTRFEVRIRPRRDDGTEDAEGLALLRALDECSRMVATARNVAMRALERADGAALDEFLLRSGGQMPRGKELEWPSRGSTRAESPLYTYRAIRAVCPKLNTTAAAWLGKDVSAKWEGSRWETLIAQTKARPHCKPTHPIPIPSAAVRLSRTDGGALAKFRLYSTDAEGSSAISIPIVPRDARQREELEALLSGEWKLGQVVLSRHHEKRGRWFLRMSYTKLVEAREGAIRVAVRRGIRSFLVVACSDGDVRSLDGGHDILEFKRRIDGRRRSFSRRARGEGAIGHGTRRSVAPLIALSDTEARFSKDRCKRAASLLAKYALSRGASEVLLEDFSSPKREGDYWIVARWPWYMLGEACANALEMVGIKVSKAETAGGRRRCPGCGHVHDKAPETTTRMVLGGGEPRTWECVACGLKRPPEEVQAINMLRDAVAEERAEGARKKAEREVAAAMSGASTNAAAEIAGALASGKTEKRAGFSRSGGGRRGKDR
jgi:hypothetical protein